MLLDEICRLAKALAPDATLLLSRSRSLHEAHVVSGCETGFELCGFGSTRAESLRLLGWAIHNELRARGLSTDADALASALEEAAA